MNSIYSAKNDLKIQQKKPNTLIFIIVSLIFSATLLSSCKKQEPPPPPPPAPLSDLPVNTSLSPEQEQCLLAKLQQRNVQIIQQGSRLQAILPVNRFFEKQTTDLKEKHVQTLKLLALYLHNYSQLYQVNYPIKIYGYTGTVNARQYRDELSNQYAQVIAAFLWNHEFSHQQMQVVGLGAGQPIANNETAQGNGYNRRVMIQVN